jgi:ribonuclease P protein component
MRVVSLKRREDFLRLRGGVRWSTGAFVIETKRRGEHSGAKVYAAVGPRFGFTVTKKLGGAVVRNRIRRRLKEALRCLEPDAALPGHDYVLIARARASDLSFERLKQDLVRGLTHVNETLRRNADGPALGRSRGKRTSERDGPDQKACEKT